MGRKDISVVLTGNKSDLKDERQVTFLEASRFAQENDALFLETSALTGENVEEVFLKAARSVLSKIESGIIDSKYFLKPVYDRGIIISNTILIHLVNNNFILSFISGKSMISGGLRPDPNQDDINSVSNILFYICLIDRVCTNFSIFLLPLKYKGGRQWLRLLIVKRRGKCSTQKQHFLYNVVHL